MAISIRAAFRCIDCGGLNAKRPATRRAFLLIMTQFKIVQILSLNYSDFGFVYFWKKSMFESIRAFIFAMMTVGLSSSVWAQSVDSTRLGSAFSVYPGAIYISPQDSSFVAPAIYRSIDSQNRIEGPLEVVQICTRDFRETNALKTLFSSVSDAAGITDVVHKDYGAKLTGLNLRYIKLNAGFELKDEMNVTATPLRVINADDDIGSTVVANIGPSCKDIIRGHIRLGRIVFVAAKAIQAENFTVTAQAGPKADGSITCSIPIICSSDSGLNGNVDYQRNRTRSSVKAVTFAIVPAEIQDNRREIRASDLR